jgi:adenylate cyclase
MSERRKLTAILSADVAGYSRLMSDDERATLHTLTMYRQIIGERVSRHDGRVVDSPGDALLAEFPSAVEAVQCSIELQQELGRRNAQLAEHRRMQFRIGINLGDVIEEKGALYGDGVNVAARLEALAEPGSFCISGPVFDQVDGKLSIRFKYLGEREVKNIPRPVRVYQPERLGPVSVQPKQHRRLRVGIGFAVAAAVAIGTAATIWQRHSSTESRLLAAHDPALAIPTGPAIAVLALQNMSGDPAQDYFADGISEEIIARLSHFGFLRVVARNTTFQYKGRSVDIRQIGREIGANYVVEGSVRKSRSTVRVTAQLLDASTGAHIWAETYERELTADNLFAVQDQITDQVVSRIGDVHGAVNRSQVQQLRTKTDASLADYECLLLAYEVSTISNS